jgi:predicted transcriptional regulator of viral defense system
MTQSLPKRLPATFTYAKAKAAGMSKRTLYRLREEGTIHALGRGLYRRGDAPPAELDLVAIATKAPRATLCLATALARHGLSDAIPAAPDVALPTGTRPPNTYARAQWHHFAPDKFDLGRNQLRLDSKTSIGIYSPERSIIDAFRLRGTEGYELAHEALRRWLRRKGSQPAALLEFAKHFPRTLNALRTALEVLL